MSKITFRADDDLVDAVKALDESKSAVIREALRAYLADRGDAPAGGGVAGDAGESRAAARDVNVNITVEPAPGGRVDAERAAARDPAARAGDDSGGDRRDGERTGSDRTGSGRTGGDGERSCSKCGAAVDADHVYCPNCGSKHSRRVFCECGDEIRADWAFCPHCGRRTASADALDR